MLRAKDGAQSGWGICERGVKRRSVPRYAQVGGGNRLCQLQACPGQDANLATSYSLNITLTNDVVSRQICYLVQFTFHSYIDGTCTYTSTQLDLLQGLTGLRILQVSPPGAGRLCVPLSGDRSFLCVQWRHSTAALCHCIILEHKILLPAQRIKCLLKKLVALYVTIRFIHACSN